MSRLMRSAMLLLLADAALGLSTAAGHSSTAPSMIGMRKKACILRQRSSVPKALYEEDPWLQGPERGPFSSPSIEALFRYGPIVWGQRCFNAGEYNASVRKLQDRWGISRQLAEQEINTLLADQNAYLANEKRVTTKPKESDLLPPVALTDKLLVLAWVAVLIPSINYLISVWP
uniref:Uncharacterized protein n=1 Tax=Chrysotila carterae TaxID=13221 RepID=A0A7S4C166_CHRCT